MDLFRVLQENALKLFVGNSDIGLPVRGYDRNTSSQWGGGLMERKTPTYVRVLPVGTVISLGFSPGTLFKRLQGIFVS